MVLSLFLSEISTECDIVLPPSISTILSFPQGHQEAPYFFFFLSLLSFFFSFPLIMCFRRQFLDRTWLTELPFLVFNPLNDELNPICHLLALLGAHHILHVSGLRVKVCRTVLSSSTLFNTSSFFTQSVQLIFYFLLQNHISKQPWFFWSTVQSIEISVPHKLPPNFSTLLLSYLNLNPTLWWKSFLIAECCFYHGNPRFNFTRGLQLAWRYTNSLKIPNSPVVFDPVDKGEIFERRK